MAICIPGPLVTAISGDVGGATFAQTRHGQIVRKRAVKLKKHSAALSFRRARFQSFHRQWEDLTDTLRTAWNVAGKRYVVHNRFGTPRTLTGFQLWMQTAMQMRYVSFTVVTTPPYMQAYPPPASLTLDFTVGGPFNITVPDPPGMPGVWARVYAARPVNSRTLTYVHHWRAVKYFAADGAAHDWFTPFTEVLGEPVVNEVVYIRTHHYLWDRPMSLPIWSPTTIHA